MKDYINIPFKYSDGGRKLAGYRGDAGDCVVRAIACAMGWEPIYRRLYQEFAARNKEAGKKKSARNGVADMAYRPLYDRAASEAILIRKLLFTHEAWEEYGPPGGSIIVSIDRHVAAIREGTLLDTHRSLTFKKHGQLYPYRVHRIWVFRDINPSIM